jgi:hypothetical protein
LSALEFQSCVARFFVDRTFRDLFAAAPDIALAQYDLTVREREEIKAVDFAHVAVFARIVAHRRFSKFRTLYNNSAEILDGRFERALSRFHQIHAWAPHRQKWQDAQDFGWFLEADCGDATSSPLVQDVVRFERLRIPIRRVWRGNEEPIFDASAAPRVPDGVDIASFRYDILAIIQAGQRGRALLEAPPTGCHAVFHGAAQQERAVTRINLLTLRMLELCDGHCSIDHISARLNLRANRSDGVLQVRAALSKLAAQSIVVSSTNLDSV